MSIINWELHQKSLPKTKIATRFIDFNELYEAKKVESLEEFAKNRLGGASKIAQNAKEKGGDALLTYQHFKVKLPYYQKAAAGKFNLAEAKKELSEHLKSIDGSTKAIALKQMDFQRIVGKIEVLGELIIKYNETR
jgi:hypothetical protein